MLEDRAGHLWVGIDDGLYLFKDGRFRRLPEPDDQPFGFVVGLTEDVEGNIWVACGSPRKLVRIRDLKVREELPAPRVAAAHTSLRIRAEASGSRHQRRRGVDAERHGRNDDSARPQKVSVESAHRR